MVAAVTGGAGVGSTVTAGSAAIAGAALSSRGGCAAKPVRGPEALELKMLSTAAGTVPTVQVCIDGRGPFPFLLSTGAGSSVVVPSLAHSLHVRKGPVTALRGVTCVPSAHSAKVKRWSMSGAELAAQHLIVADVSVAGASTEVKGIIGSDVLARFGAVRIDYATGRLVLLGRERPAPTGDSYVLGEKRAVPPAPLAEGAELEVGAPLRIFETPEGTIVAVPVKISGRTTQLAVDTGSPSSDLVPAVVPSLRLRHSGAKVASSGIGCRGVAPAYVVGAWSLGDSPLRGSTLEARPIAGTVNSGLQGVLGSDVLASDGSVIVDYGGAHLWLVKS